MHVSELLTIDWSFSRQDYDYELEVGSVLLELSEERLHVVHSRDVALEEWLLGHWHTSIVADSTKLVDKLPTKYMSCAHDTLSVGSINNVKS